MENKGSKVDQEMKLQVHLEHPDCPLEPEHAGPCEGIGQAITDVRGSHPRSMRRDRPYDGQPHTDHGIRGATEIKGITFRDLRDAYVRAWFLASSHVNYERYEEALKGENADLNENMLFGWNIDQVDPVAVAQSLSCEIERLMGIYPNVPDLKTKDPGHGR